MEEKTYLQYLINDIQADFNYEEFKSKLDPYLSFIREVINIPDCPNLLLITFKYPQSFSFVVSELNSFSTKPIINTNIIPIDFDISTINLFDVIYITNFSTSSDICVAVHDFLEKFSTNSDAFDIQPTNNPMVAAITVRKKSLAHLIYTFLPYVKVKNVNITISTNSIEIPVITVSNLPLDFRVKEFENFKCPIKRTGIKYHNSIDSTQTVSISFANNIDANNSIKYFNGAIVDGNEIIAMHFLDSDTRKSMNEFQIIVKRIVETASSFDLYHFFKQFGNLHHAIVQQSPNGTYGIVQYYTHEDASNALKALKEQKAPLEVGFLCHFSVIAFNLHPSVTSKDLRALYPNASNINIKKSKNEVYAILTFKSINDAKNASKQSHVFQNLKIKCIYGMMPNKALELYRKEKEDEDQKESEISMIMNIMI